MSNFVPYTTMLATKEIKLLLLAITVAILMPSCLKFEEFPIEPTVEFNEFVQYNDSARIKFHFTDGDGDIGLNAGDTFPPYDTLPYYYNLFLEYFELHDGQWELVDLTLPLYYRVPVITPTGQNKALEGDMDILLYPWPTLPNTSGDTVKYSLKLVDRALHESNVVETGNIIVP